MTKGLGLKDKKSNWRLNPAKIAVNDRIVVAQLIYKSFSFHAWSGVPLKGLQREERESRNEYAVVIPVAKKIRKIIKVLVGLTKEVSKIKSLE